MSAPDTNQPAARRSEFEHLLEQGWTLITPDWRYVFSYGDPRSVSPEKASNTHLDAQGGGGDRSRIDRGGPASSIQPGDPRHTPTRDCWCNEQASVVHVALDCIRDDERGGWRILLRGVFTDHAAAPEVTNLVGAFLDVEASGEPGVFFIPDEQTGGEGVDGG